MNDDPLDVRQAIADVALLRRVLHQIEQRRTSQESAGLFGTTLNANMLLQRFVRSAGAGDCRDIFR